ncbi:MAG: hypothetical protein ACYS14_01810 [Planctomycetota bacterium]|jgi:hypothetical protein
MMELTAEQEREIKAIIAEIGCPKDFRCYESKFEDITPVIPIPDANLVQCRKAAESYCPMSRTFGINAAFCECALRKYAAFNLGR